MSTTAAVPPDPRLGEPRFWEAALRHTGAWTEQDYNALPEDLRAELYHGTLILTPGVSFAHGRARHRLCAVLDRFVDPALVGPDTDVRLAAGYVYYRPDVLVLREYDPGRPIDPANLQLVAEFVSRGGGKERRDKMVEYAMAHVPGYLILDEKSEGYAADYYVLDGGDYVRAGHAAPGGVLTIDEPFHAVIDLAGLA